MSRALVVGNGESRKYIDLTKLQTAYTLIGCNALHRDYKVDHLICCDRRMADEAVKNSNTVSTQIYVRDSWYHYFRKILKNKNINKLPTVPNQSQQKKDNPDHWGSGCYAILLAAHLGFNQIDLIGFDLYPTNQKVNNIYKGSQNYSKLDALPVDYSYWVYQTTQVFKNYQHIKFTVFNKSDWVMPEDWQIANVEFRNIASITVDL